MIGDEKIAKLQTRLMNKVRIIITSMIENTDNYCTAGTEIIYDAEAIMDIFIKAEEVIKIFIPDGNYLGFNSELVIINISKATLEAIKKDYNNAMLFLQKAREYAIAFDEIVPEEFTFTTPLFNHVKINKREWGDYVSQSALDSLRTTLSVLPVFEPLKDYEGYAELIK